MRAFVLLPLVALLAMLPISVEAQEPVGNAQATIGYIKPINAIFGVYTGEVEHRLQPSATVGALVSYINFSGVADYAAAVGKYRFYLDGEALEGFSAGALGGLMGIGADDFDGGREWGMGITAGAELGYTFRLGEDRGWAVQLATGAQRIFPVGTDVDDIRFVLPTGGISVGYAF